MLGETGDGAAVARSSMKPRRVRRLRGPPDWLATLRQYDVVLGPMFQNVGQVALMGPGAAGLSSV